VATTGEGTLGTQNAQSPDQFLATVASGFAVGTADLVIDVTGWWR